MATRQSCTPPAPHFPDGPHLLLKLVLGRGWGRMRQSDAAPHTQGSTGGVQVRAHHGHKVEIIRGVVAGAHQQHRQLQAELAAREGHRFWRRRQKEGTSSAPTL